MLVTAAQAVRGAERHHRSRPSTAVYQRGGASSRKLYLAVRRQEAVMVRAVHATRRGIHANAVVLRLPSYREGTDPVRGIVLPLLSCCL